METHEDVFTLRMQYPGNGRSRRDSKDLGSDKLTFVSQLEESPTTLLRGYFLSQGAKCSRMKSAARIVASLVARSSAKVRTPSGRKSNPLPTPG